MSDKNKVVIEFDNEIAAQHFKNWLDGQGEQDYWTWMEYRELEEKGFITVTDNSPNILYCRFKKDTFIMTETYELGATPVEEDCAQVGSDNYTERARIECRAYVNQLYRFLESKGYVKENLPDSFRLTVKGNAHDYGTYYEVVAKFNDNDEKAFDLANLIESEGPEHWDDIALQEINFSVD